MVCYSIIGKNNLIKAGSLVKQRGEFEDNSIIEGFPGKSVGKNKKRLEIPNWAKRS